MPRIVLSWSGGKDCALALARLLEDPACEVRALLTNVTTGLGRVSVHGVRTDLLRMQAHAIGIPLIELALPPQPSNDVYEAAFRGAFAMLRRDQPDVDGMAFGDIHLADLRTYRERLVHTCDARAYFPLWGEPSSALADEVIRRGIEARIVCVDLDALDATWAGRAYDRATLAALPAHIDPCGERGEFHTFVHAAPFMQREVPYAIGATTQHDDRFAWCDLLPVPR